MQNPEKQVRHDDASVARPASFTRRIPPSRRTFLIGGTAAGLAAAASTQAATSAQASERSANANPIPSAAIGYWNRRSETVTPAARLTWDARQRVENRVHVTVHGLGNGHPDPTIAAFSLFAHFPTKQAGVRVPFHAWQYRSDVLSHRSSPVRFSMPFSRTEGLMLSFVYPQKRTTEAGVTAVRTEHHCNFSLAAWNKQPKLRHGVYFVALPDSRSNALPDWDDCRFVPEYTAGVLTGGALWSGQTPVLFHYLILSVDPEQSSESAAA